MNRGRRNKCPRPRWRLYEAIDQWISSRAIQDEIIREVSKNALCLSIVSIFMLGPCWGDDETSLPPQSVFLFTVTKADQNKFTVMDMPPYVP